MTRFWDNRCAGYLAIGLVAAGLVYLQLADAELELYSALPAYAAIALGALGALAFFQSQSSTCHSCLYATTGFFGYLLLRALTSPVEYAARSDIYSILAALVIYGITILVLDVPARRFTLILLLLLAAVVHVLAGVVQTGMGKNLAVASFLENLTHESRATGLYANPDHLAGLLEVLGIFGLSIACWSRRPGWMRVCIAYVSVICYLGVVLTGSRAGYVSVAASLTTFVLLSAIALRSAGTRAMLTYGAIGVILLASGLVASGIMINRDPELRARTQNMFVDQGRLQLWGAAFDQWKLQPVVGTGSGTYRYYGRKFRDPQMQQDPVVVHNDYLQLLAEYGFVGAAGLLLFLGTHFRQAWRAFRRLGPERLSGGSLLGSDRLALTIAALAAITAYGIHSAVDFNLHLPANAMLMALAFGIAANAGSGQTTFPKLKGERAPQIVTAAVAGILLLQALRLLPAEAFTDKARIALADENPTLAFSLAGNALHYDRRNPNTFFYLGRSLEAGANLPTSSSSSRTESYQKALQAFAEAARLAPLDEIYYLDMAYTYDRLGRYQEGEAMFDIARSLDPRSDAIKQLYQAHLDAWKNGEAVTPSGS